MRRMFLSRWRSPVLACSFLVLVSSCSARSSLIDESEGGVVPDRGAGPFAGTFRGTMLFTDLVIRSDVGVTPPPPQPVEMTLTVTDASDGRANFTFTFTAGTCVFPATRVGSNATFGTSTCTIAGSSMGTWTVRSGSAQIVGSVVTVRLASTVSGGGGGITIEYDANGTYGGMRLAGDAGP